MAKFTVEITTDKAAFSDHNMGTEIKECLNRAGRAFDDIWGDGDQVEALKVLSMRIRDSYGNTVGEWRYEQ